MTKFVVVDVETTGFGRNDRLVEISILTLDPATCEVVDEFDTLINPERDVGPTGVHGVTASMVQAAPTFSEIAPAVAERLQGAVIIAHNAAFDIRMIKQEFERLRVTIDLGEGLCTYRETRKKLVHACDALGIHISQQHRALADARATAELARRLRLTKDALTSRPVTVDTMPTANYSHTLRRGLADAGTSPMHRVLSRAALPDFDSVLLQYLDMLDWVLDDGVIDKGERGAMQVLAHDLGISEYAQQNAHRAYLECIITAAWRDGFISADEQELITRIAHQLEVYDITIPDVTLEADDHSIQRGSRVCFTGLADKKRFEDIAWNAGLIPVSNVTRKGCDVLVSADVATSSGKGRKARKYGIPVIPVDRFLQEFNARESSG